MVRVVNMSEEEHTGERSLKYSAFHRELGQGYMMVDVDCVEWRWSRGIVALCAVTGRMKDEAHILNCKRFVWERTLVERLALAQIAVALKVPAYYVLHDEGLSVFHVHEITSGNFENYRRLTRDEYANFIKSL